LSKYLGVEMRSRILVGEAQPQAYLLSQHGYYESTYELALRRVDCPYVDVTNYSNLKIIKYET
jgi:hypothetical protein